MFPLVCFSPLNVNWDEEQIPTRLQSRILSTAPLSCACKKKKKKRSVYKCVSGLTIVFVVGTAVWELSSTSSWDLHQTQWGCWHKEGQEERGKQLGWFYETKRLIVLINYFGKKKKILLKEIILSEKLELLLQTSITSQNISKEI